MTEYISVDQLYKCETCAHYRDSKCDTWCDAGESYRPAESRFKKADVVAVKHGEWEKFQGERFICNCCARVFNLGSLATLSDVKRLWKYCPNCGAKMDEERKDK